MGFSILVWFVLVPYIAICLLIMLFNFKLAIKLLGVFFLGIVILILSIGIYTSLHSKKVVKRKHIIGDYVIDRSKFSGENSNWQYNHYKLEITKRNELIVKYIDSGIVHSMDTVKVEFLEDYRNNRIKISQESTHHMFKEHPELIREIWSFYYVIHSEKYGNMFFKKGKWKMLN
jgi:hypothetical protein